MWIWKYFSQIDTKYWKKAFLSLLFLTTKLKNTMNFVDEYCRYWTNISRTSNLSLFQKCIFLISEMNSTYPFLRINILPLTLLITHLYFGAIFCYFLPFRHYIVSNPLFWDNILLFRHYSVPCLILDQSFTISALYCI